MVSARLISHPRKPIAVDFYFNLPIREGGNACVKKRNGLFAVHHVGTLNRELNVWVDCVQMAVEVAKIL